jgi:hypothetical protein
MSISVNVKCSNADKYEVSVAASASVAEFKQALAAVSGVAAEDQRLIHKGRVLKDDAALDFYGVEDGQTVHLVKGGKSRAQGNSSAPPASSASSSLPGVYMYRARAVQLCPPCCPAALCLPDSAGCRDATRRVLVSVRLF